MTYLVIEPKKVNGTVKLVPTAMLDDLEGAKRVAQQAKNYLVKKGWNSWADKVSIRKPKNAQGYLEAANQISEYWQAIDWASNGNSFSVEPLREIQKTLLIRADQLENPESYAD